MAVPKAWTVEAAGGDVRMTYGYLTDIITGYNEAEQRVALRTFPLETVEFSILETGRTAQLVHSLVYGLGDEVIAVPLWQYGQVLTQDFPLGGSIVEGSDHLNVPFERQFPSYLMVWQDAFNFQVCTIAFNFGFNIVVSDAADRDWPAFTTKLYPMRLAKLSGPQRLRWLDSPPTVEGRVAFTCEGNLQ